MNWDSLRRTKEFSTAAATGFALIIVRHDRVDIDRAHAPLIARLRAEQSHAKPISINSPTDRTRRLPRLSMPSIRRRGDHRAGPPAL